MPLNNKHRIPIAEETVTGGDRMGVGVADRGEARKRRDEHQER